MGTQHSHHNHAESTERIIIPNTNSVTTQTTVNYQTTQLPAQSVSYVQPTQLPVQPVPYVQPTQLPAQSVPYDQPTQYALPTQYDSYVQNQYTLPPQYTTNYYAQIEAFKTPDGVEKEPMLLLDTTGSMNDPTSEGSKIPRYETVKEAIKYIVEKLGEQDSQAVHEEEGGGLRTITFAGGEAEDIDDINLDNLQEKWDDIEWAGSTSIMPGWDELKDVYMEEFGNREPADRPLLMGLVVTDGEADDLNEFAEALKDDHNSYVVIALLGYGRDHDIALESFNRVANENPRVKVIPFGSKTSPKMIADTLLRMIE
jgi:hypothetical protein